MRGRKEDDEIKEICCALPSSPFLSDFLLRRCETDEMGDRIELTHYYTVVLHKGGGELQGKRDTTTADGNELELEGNGPVESAASRGIEDKQVVL